jgi:hypothetical protein
MGGKMDHLEYCHLAKFRQKKILMHVYEFIYILDLSWVYGFMQFI